MRFWHATVSIPEVLEKCYAGLHDNTGIQKRRTCSLIPGEPRQNRTTYVAASSKTMQRACRSRLMHCHCQLIYIAVQVLWIPRRGLWHLPVTDACRLCGLQRRLYCCGCVTIAVDMFVRHRALEYPTVADVCGVSCASCVHESLLPIVMQPAVLRPVARTTVLCHLRQCLDF